MQVRLLLAFLLGFLLAAGVGALILSMIVLLDPGAWPKAWLPTTPTLAPRAVASPVPLPAPSSTPVSTPPPVVSGGRLALDWTRQHNQDIYVLDLNQPTVRPIRLTANATSERSPAWSPDGTRIAFASRRDRNWDLYLLNLTTGQTTRLTDHAHFDDHPTWSPDGQYIAFESMRAGDLDIFVLRLSDGTITQITGHPAPDYAPAWSPDGRYIAFVSWRDGNREIYLVSSSGETAPFNVTRNPANDYAPAWSGQEELVFVSDRGGGPRLFVQRIHPGGTVGLPLDAQEVTWSGTHHPLTLTWVPGGQGVSYVDASEWGYAVILQNLNRRNGAAALFGAEEPIGRLDWTATEGPLPESDLVPAPVPMLYTETVGRARPPYQLKYLPGVQAPNARLSDRVDDSFNALRQRVVAETGHDFLSKLSDAWRPIDARVDGSSFQSWHKAGRAFDTRQEFQDAGGQNLLVVAKEIGIGYQGRDRTFWRLYLRTVRQDGSMGEPLKQAPWDFNARFAGGMAARNGGRRLPVPAGYYVDFTALASEYGWERIPANDRPGFSWKRDWKAIEYWHFEKHDGLSWREAMLELYDRATYERYFGTGSR